MFYLNLDPADNNFVDVDIKTDLDVLFKNCVINYVT